MKVIKEIRTSIHSQLNDLRSMKRILDSVIFESAFVNSDLSEQSRILDLVSQNKRNEILVWLRSKTEKITVLELREEAKQLGIKDYNVLSKTGLLARIEAKRRK